MAEDPAALLLGHARVWIELRRWSDAESTLRQVLALDPQSGEAMYLLAHVLLRAGRPWDALPMARAAVFRTPDSPAALRMLSWAQQVWYAKDEAVVSAREAARLEPNDSSNHVRLAEAQLAVGDVKGAEESAANARSLSPEQAGVWVVSANVALARRRPRIAMRWFRQALQMAPEDYWALYGLASAYLHQGRLFASLYAYAGAIRVNPETPAARKKAVGVVRFALLLVCFAAFLAILAVGHHTIGVWAVTIGTTTAVLSIGGTIASRRGVPPEVRIAVGDAVRQAPVEMRRQADDLAEAGRAARRVARQRREADPYMYSIPIQACLFALGLAAWTVTLTLLVVGAGSSVAATAAEVPVALGGLAVMIGSAVVLRRAVRARQPSVDVTERPRPPHPREAYRDRVKDLFVAEGVETIAFVRPAQGIRPRLIQRARNTRISDRVPRPRAVWLVLTDRRLAMVGMQPRRDSWSRPPHRLRPPVLAWDVPRAQIADIYIKRRPMRLRTRIRFVDSSSVTFFGGRRVDLDPMAELFRRRGTVEGQTNGA